MSGRVMIACLAAGGLAAVTATAALPHAPTPPPPRVLRVCSDPNNLPFSNLRQAGFENRIAGMIAADLGARLQYTWWAQRRGFVRNTLAAGRCDLVLGVPADFEPVATTAPYYRSTYVFVTRRDAGPPISSFDDPRLKRLRIGVHLIGDDYANPPPVVALGRRGMVRNVVGYSIYGDYREPNPPARLIEAVARGEVDVAVVWGPLGGYFAGRERLSLRVTPVRSAERESEPMEFAIAMGVRRPDTEFRNQLDAWLVQHRAQVDEVLAEYGIPLLPGSSAQR